VTSIQDIMAEAERLKDQILELCHPVGVILFGSAAAGAVRPGSDIDLCVIAEYADRRALLTALYTALDSPVGVDIVLYRPEEWARNSVDPTSFAHLILQKGKWLYG